MIDQSTQNYIYEIKKKLKEFAEDPKRQKQCRARTAEWKKGWTPCWTKDIMLEIGNMGKRKGFDVRADWFKGVPPDWRDSKRLYDLYWVKKDGSLPLALECEWEPARFKIEEDFDKLLKSPAALRVMIFHRWLRETDMNTVKDSAKCEIKNLICRIEACSDPQSEANYLFCAHCTHKEGSEFIFRCYPDAGE